jgi:hypothetical protein
MGDCTLIGFQEIGSPGRIDMGTGVGALAQFPHTGACQICVLKRFDPI